MNLSEVLTDDFYRLLSFEQKLARVWEEQGHVMSDSALIVPLHETEGAERFVALAMRHALGVNITSPEPGMIRLSHVGCEATHDGCFFDGMPRDMPFDQAVKALTRVMTVMSVLETAQDMATELLNSPLDES